VTLTGTTASAAERELADRIALNTDGVVAVNNRLTVGGKPVTSEAKGQATKAAHETGDEVSDAWITAKVKSTLLFSRNVDGLEVAVTTNSGVVSLSGSVNNSAQRELAVELAQNVVGVKKVDASGLKAG
jgi:hyperosmotically inducible periplasmic protein